MSGDDQRLGFQAAFDQFGAGLRDMSPVLGGYLEALRQAGFTNKQAMLLVRDFHWLLWCKNHWPDSDPPWPVDW